jgi:hypothetical protein
LSKSSAFLAQEILLEKSGRGMHFAELSSRVPAQRFFERRRKMIFTEIMWLVVVAYSVAQFAMLLESHGRTRIAIALPLLIMVPVFFQAISAMQYNNMPVMLFVASPVALAYLVFVAYRSVPIPAAMPRRLDGTARFR